jgi:hypothetical protein
MSDPAKDMTALQMSGRDPEGRSILSTLVKRTYLVLPHGECALAKEQLPLILESVYAPGDERLLLADVDVWPFKPRTDVVVHGHAYNHPGRAVFDASVKVGNAVKAVRVLGDRRAMLSADGKILFSAPAPPEKVPLSFALAYGGRDHVTERELGNPAEALARYLPANDDPAAMVAAASPFVYRRNPSGRGYVVKGTREAVEATSLPNLEHPEDPLTPDRLVAGSTARWPVQPLPASLGWMDYGCFPRIAWLGLIPYCELPEDAGSVGEIRFGFATRALFEEAPGRALQVDFAGINGASLGLRLPYLRGDETIELVNLSPDRPSFRFKLPGHRPRLWVDGRKGKLVEAEPVIHTVVIEADVPRLTILWRGSAPALRPYLDHELPGMPFRVTW